MCTTPRSRRAYQCCTLRARATTAAPGKTAPPKEVRACRGRATSALPQQAGKHDQHSKNAPYDFHNSSLSASMVM
jgi:hypothetical protein